MEPTSEILGHGVALSGPNGSDEEVSPWQTVLAGYPFTSALFDPVACNGKIIQTLLLDHIQCVLESELTNVRIVDGRAREHSSRSWLSGCILT